MSATPTRRASLAALLAVSAVLLTACGGSDGPKTVDGAALFRSVTAKAAAQAKAEDIADDDRQHADWKTDGTCEQGAGDDEYACTLRFGASGTLPVAVTVSADHKRWTGKTATGYTLAGTLE